MLIFSTIFPTCHLSATPLSLVRRKYLAKFVDWILVPVSGGGKGEGRGERRREGEEKKGRRRRRGGRRKRRGERGGRKEEERKR